MHNEQKAPLRSVSAAGIVAPARKSAPPQPPIASPAPKRTSAAGLTVPNTKPAVAPPPAACEPLRTEAERRALFDRLRALRDSIASVKNANDRAVALITACISGGICTKPGIVSALNHLGMHPGHAGKMVDRGPRPCRPCGGRAETVATACWRSRALGARRVYYLHHSGQTCGDTPWGEGRGGQYLSLHHLREKKGGGGLIVNSTGTTEAKRVRSRSPPGLRPP